MIDHKRSRRLLSPTRPNLQRNLCSCVQTPDGPAILSRISLVGVSHLRNGGIGGREP